MESQQVTENRLKRERKARKEAERLLESKSAELYRANQELQNLADNLEQQVDERTRELTRMRDQALQGSRVKGAFLANMSHEIRTPLSGIIGMSELLLESNLSSSQKERIEIILDSSRALLGILNDILDVSKLEAGKLDLRERPFDICRLVDEVAETLAEPLRAKRLELQLLLHPKLPRLLQGDDARLRQILLNLLSNAIKFTERGHIALSLTPGDMSGEKISVRFEVQDTGIGITTEDQSRLFRKFSQLDTGYEKQHQGTGLGLSICKTLAERMGGTIGCQSEIGHGSVFWFTALLQHSAGQQPPRDVSLCTPLITLDLTDDLNTHLSGQLDYLGLTCLRLDSMTSLRAHLDAAPAEPPLVLVEASAYAGKTRTQLAELRTRSQIRVARLHWEGADTATAKDSVDAIIVRPITHENIYKALSVSQQTLPAQTPATESTATEARKTILLAEDSKALQIVTRARLEKLGYRVFVAENGLEALELLTEKHIDLILMDIQMPEMDGITATRCIRDSSDQAVCTLPIIALTAYAMKGDQETFMDAGMDGYLTKPLENAALEKTVNHWLTKAS